MRNKEYFDMNMKTYEAKNVADMLGLNVHTLRMWCRRGYCDAGRSLGGGKWLFTAAQVREIGRMLEQGEVREADELCHAHS
jgi:DNA-binding transcriptional MerR regulator